MKVKIDKKYLLFLSLIMLLGFILRISFAGNTLIENDALLFTEAVKIANGIFPWPSYSAPGMPFFLSGWYGWFLADLRALLYLMFPFLKAQYYLTVIFGLLVIISTTRLAIRLYSNKKIALFSAFLVSIIPNQVSMSYGVSAEVPATFFMLEAINFLLDWVENNRKSFFIISSICLSFAMLSKPIGFLVVPTLLLVFIINRIKIHNLIPQKIFIYFVIAFSIFATWIVPNYRKFAGNLSHSFLSFMVKIGSETMKEGVLFSHIRFFSIYGLILLGFSGCYFLFRRRRPDIYIAFFITSSLLILGSLKDVMTYWYPFIVPFYCILISRTAIFIRKIIIKFVYIGILIFFIFICLKTDLFNIDFDYASQYGYLMRLKNDYMEIMPTSQGVLNTIVRMKQIVKPWDHLYVMHNYMSYEGLFLDRKPVCLPVYAYVEGDEIKYNNDWGSRVKEIIENNPPGTSLLMLQDGAYYYRVYDKGVWRQTDLSAILEANGFEKVYENYYPNANVINKCKKYYSSCSNEQWVKNYIYRK